jgi:hypothetical protein
LPDTPINLNRARKARARDAARKTADANAVRFGRSKSERAAATTEADAFVRRLDGHRRDTSAEGEEPS